MGLLDRFKKKDDPEIQALIAELSEPDWKRRAQAARRLGELGARAGAAQPALEEAIADDNGEVCLAASDALSKIRKAAL